MTERTGRPRVKTDRDCESCGRSFYPRNHRAGRFCSWDCYIASKPVHQTGRSANERTSDQRAASRREVVMECRHCGSTYCPLLRRGAISSYCSEQCRRRAYSKSRRSTPEGRAQRLAHELTRIARKKGAGRVEKIVSRVVFDRDGWVCGLCDEPIPRDAPSRHQLSGSVDHIIPLAKGGTHTYDNVQAAHLICNGRKGDRAVA